MPPWYLDEVQGHPCDLSLLEALGEGTLGVACPSAQRHSDWFILNPIT